MNEITQFGNRICRSFGPEDRYVFDARLLKEGWRQYDTTQDASYFGVWVHENEMKILTFAEGDVMLVECQTPESFAREIEHMDAYYGPPPPSFTVLDTEGKVIRLYDERPGRRKEAGNG